MHITPTHHRRNGMHIRKVQNKSGISYQVIVKVMGQSQSATFSTKGDAREWGVKKEKEMLEARHFPDRAHQHYVLKDALEKYRTEILPRKAPHSQKTHGYILTWWEKNLGNTHLSNIDTALVENYRQLLLKKPLHIHTVNSYTGVLKHVFSLANSPHWNMTRNNPFKYLPPLRVKEERNPHLTKDQIDSLLRAAKEYEESTTRSRSPHMYLFIRLALATGGRLKELLNATWSQVNFTAKTFTFVKTKTHKDRTVPLDSSTIEFLKDVMEKQMGLTPTMYTNRLNRLTHEDAMMFAHQSYLFLNEQTGKPVTDIHKSWIVLKKHADVPEDLRCHDLRHQYASNMARAGADLGTLADLLGHTNVQQSRRYRHLTHSHATPFVERMAEMIF